ncbi:chromosome segregation protein SMC [Georgenia sp. Z1491]|uniref:chromosome segregation protein SMC n=1 Tax=Georgenia sp. Z1491 TaxID=3416707 RepID=UPI003CFB28AF
MYLKTLTMRGFKSFASATTLHLEPGITCVVGPNGSGKSNVVDALSWVMGEQGAKSLRGGSMQDVIFAGTTGRAPLGRAEVSLTIDNTDGVLPIEYTEVTISRTLFRSGGSEYQINGESCRLLDIQELLSDTGMGKEMHVIVGQGRLDSVLQATAEDRRGFIEEAAGVLKHRRRKEKALRKLEATAANLARLSDLTAEIRRQLGPLARQADVARRAQVVQTDLRDARARLLADDLAQLRAAADSATTDTAAIAARLEQAEGEQDVARRSLAALEQAAADAAPRLGAATDTWYRLSGVRERLRALTDVATERVRLLGGTGEEHDDEGPAQDGDREGAGRQDDARDPDVLQARAEQARAAEAELGVELDAARTTLTDAEARRTEAETAERAAEHALAAVHRADADRREGLARLTGQVAERRSRLEAAQAELDRLHDAEAAARTRAEDAQREFDRLERDVAGAESGEEDLDDAYERAADRLAAAEAETERLDEDLRAAEEARTSAQSRAEALALGLAASDAAPAGDVEGLLGPLPEHLEVEAEWADAVAAALGPLAAAHVVASLDAAVTALRASREEGSGKLRLVVAADPGADAPPAAGGSSAGDLPDGVVAAPSVVTARTDVAVTLARLLDRVVLAEDLTAARAAVAARPDLTAVTSDGDVVGAAAVSGGGGEESSVLSLHAAHEQALADVDDAARRAEATRFALGPAREEVEAARAQAAGALDALHASDAEMSAVTERLGRLRQTIRDSGTEVERSGPAREQAETALAEHREVLAELGERLELAGREPEEAEADLERATTERDQATAAAREARSAETDTRLALRTVEERVSALAGRAASLEAAARTERAARAAAADRAARRRRQAAVAAEVHERAQEGVAAADRAVGEAAARRAEAEAEREDREKATTSVRSQLAEIDKTLLGLRDAAHREELARTEHTMRVRQAEERSVEELGTDPDVLLEEYGPHVLVPSTAPVADGEEPPEPRPFVREEQVKRLARAEKDLARLGKVNPLALEEHAALEERHQFLTEQLADLTRSREDLLQIVKDIDARVEEVFTSAFHDTAAQFERVFPRLFPGGEGRLVLTDPDDMLTTGIEIEARPAGKKVKRLSLLSGGERSLTAVALLVAIFTARPSPFYVMDEVEAALDDVNLGRLIEIFAELRESSQLIVITHQKRTMEVADALYGVTMRGGLSTVISQRIERADASA